MTSIDFCQRVLGTEASAIIDWNNYRLVYLRVACENPTDLRPKDMKPLLTLF